MSDKEDRSWMAHAGTFGPVGCENPCYIPPKDPPREPGETLEARRLRELTQAWQVANYDLSENAELMTSLAPKIYEELQQQMAEGESAEVALANVTAAIRRVIPKPTDELKYRADKEVERLLAERRKQGQGQGLRPR